MGRRALRRVPPAFEVVMNQPRDSFSERYKELYDHFPGFAYRTRVVEYERGVSYLCRQEVVSEGSFDIFGLSPQAMYGFNAIEKNTHPEDIAYVRKATQEALDSGRTATLIYRVLHVTTKQIKWVREEQRCICDEEGRPTHLEGFLIDVSREKLYEIQLEEENRRLRRKQDEAEDRLEGMLGRSEAMHALFQCLRRASPGESSVILYGETGSGKDIAARTVHQLSGRKGPFVPVNCGAIPENLLESEFFGHVKGAFSGAVTGREGYLAAADGGTLFLDEVGELPVHLQVKLLRAIENKSFTPVGSSRVCTSDFRLICATNRDLSAFVREGRMRSDFYYRIHVLTIGIPPLRDRREDLLLLSEEYLRKRGVSWTISPLVQKRMMAYDWPGNIRELYNFLDRCIAFGSEAAQSLISVYEERDGGEKLDETLDEAVARTERSVIGRCLKELDWNVGRTALRLGVSRSTLQRKMREYGFVRPGSAR